MTTTFPHAKRSSLGYDVAEVEAFLTRAREAYDADVADAADSAENPRLSSSDIRQASFGMRKGGYSCRHVDAALERLELAFARRERDRQISETGTEDWIASGQARAEILLARFERPAKHRFNRVGFLSRGYSTADVDKFVNTASAALGEGQPLTADEVRSAIFRPRFRGYHETQVDFALDGLVEVLLAVATD